MSNLPALYRKRFIPQETVHLKDDKILHLSEQLIVTKWNSLKPRLDIPYGISGYFIEKGFKVSKIFDKDNAFVHWYCDIIRTIPDAEGNSIVFEDLLVDVIVQKDNFVKVVDLEEAADAHEAGLIDGNLLHMALRQTNELLGIIYGGRFHEYQSVIEGYEVSVAAAGL